MEKIEYWITMSIVEYWEWFDRRMIWLVPKENTDSTVVDNQG